MPKSGITYITTQDETNNSLDFGATIPWTKEVTEENLPDDIIFPRELNLFLRNRIQDLTAENGCLRRALDEAEEKIQRDRGTAETVQGRILGKSNELAAAKIIELSKRCREQISEIEVLKSKCKNLEYNLTNNKATELENERRERGLTKIDSSNESTENNQPKIDEDRLKHLLEKLQQTQGKLYESKNNCASLKQEINKLHKLLCSEIGENLNFGNLLLNQPGGWRGRAEQIHLLQQKVTELQTKLSDYEGMQKKTSIERKNLANVRNVEKERRRQMEDSAKQLRQAEVAVEGYKRKLEASKARIKVLENELNVARGNIAILNEKRFHDDHLIETLGNRLKTAETKHQEREVEMKNKEERIERERTNLQNDLESAQLQIDRFRRKLKEREIEIDKLRNGTVSRIGEIKARNTVQTEVFPNHFQHDSPPRTVRSTREPNEYVTLALAAEAERERLLELITVLNRRLDKEKNDADILSHALRNEKNKSAKLELKIRKLETERVGIVRIDTGYRAKLPKSLKSADETMDVEQMRLKMELLQEECLALKVRLDTVQQAKAADLAAYKQMYEQVKRIFQEACTRSKPPPTIGSRSIITV
ncbi:Coiled-coil domain-containing protein 13 [Habropoda laboriosa]|uniref:Coiled-coil domain-containing protein 13 n=1 Tax=Habropoda laboriosa TaxID=597456 RepID=A0A0L7RBX8_9HYME|nr:PREDICTED: coiled-coil domain-containing protein 13-like [Habropoda laboriosa]KOC68310.1 Coiled-coil domain-containing protein 13 [Habropoda laboriosa]